MMRRLFLTIGICLMLSVVLIGSAMLPGWLANSQGCLLVTTSERYAPVTHRYVVDAPTGVTLRLQDDLEWVPVSSSPRARVFNRYLPQHSEPSATRYHYDVGVTAIDSSGYVNIRDMVIIQPNIVLNTSRDFPDDYWQTNLLWSNDWHRFGFRWQDADGQTFFTIADEDGTSVQTQPIEATNLATNELVSWSSDTRYVLMRDLVSGNNYYFLIWDTQTGNTIKFDTAYDAWARTRGMVWSPTAPILTVITPDPDGIAQLTLFSLADNTQHTVKLPKLYEPQHLWWSPTGQYVGMQGFQRLSSTPSLSDPGIYRFVTSTGDLLPATAEWADRGSTNYGIDFRITMGMWSSTGDRWYFMHLKSSDSRANLALDALEIESGEVETIADQIVGTWISEVFNQSEQTWLETRHRGDPFIPREPLLNARRELVIVSGEEDKNVNVDIYDTQNHRRVRVVTGAEHLTRPEQAIEGVLPRFLGATSDNTLISVQWTKGTTAYFSWASVDGSQQYNLVDVQQVKTIENSQDYLLYYSTEYARRSVSLIDLRTGQSYTLLHDLAPYNQIQAWMQVGGDRLAIMIDSALYLTDLAGNWSKQVDPNVSWDPRWSPDHGDDGRLAYLKTDGLNLSLTIVDAQGDQRLARTLMPILDSTGTPLRPELPGWTRCPE